MDTPCYDLVLRDPGGGVLERWPLDGHGWPCDGLGRHVGQFYLWNEIVKTAQADMAARKKSA